MKYDIIFIFIFCFIIANAQTNNIIKGKVYDKVDKKPLVGVNILVEELKTGTVTNGDGSFELTNIPQGEYHLSVSYIGHETVHLTVKMPSDEEQFINVFLEEKTLRLQEVIITGNPLEINPKQISQPSIVLSNLNLQIKRNSTIAQTLDYQPGIAMQSNGIAPSKPVIRGMSSNRILILEDGLRMGDLSNTAVDHAISEDGSSPEKIEVVRGSASLLYGSNAIGGVVNVITETIPTTVLQKLIGEAVLRFGSVNDEKLGRIHLGYGIDKFSLHGDYFKKITNDYETPFGSRVDNSDFKSDGFKFGAAFLPAWGILGASINNYTSKYGIPFNPNEEGKESPVSIDLEKNEYRILAEMEDINSFIKSFSFKGGYNNYKHDEIELETGEVGSSFSLKTYSADLSFRQVKIRGLESLNGAFGLWLLNQTYEVEGKESLTPNANYNSTAGFFYEQINLGNLSLNFGGRFENNRIDIPEAELFDSLFAAKVKSFNSISGSLGLIYNFTEELQIFTNLANAFRAPTVEELSSFAIHAATESFDVGNRNLEKENNLGADFGVRYNSSIFTFEGSVYYNKIFNYIFREPSAIFYSEWNPVGFNDSIGLPVFNYIQADAELYGFEFKTVYEIYPGFTISLMSDYVRAKNLITKNNLPLTPPIRFAFEPQYTRDYYWFGIFWKIAAEQNSVAENETPTAGYGILDLYAGLKFLTGNFVHTIDLKANNVLNQSYRDHLSAIKEFALMPGKNFSISYRLLF